MEPQNRLFATLDVTLHLGVLPSNINVLYVDTIGFISDIPTKLIASFASTLEDIKFATDNYSKTAAPCQCELFEGQQDLLIHVRDVSHPDTVLQKAIVMTTLSFLDLPKPLIENMVEVCNKIDLVTPEKLESVDKAESAILTSCTMGTGLLDLNLHLDKLVAQTGIYVKKCFRIPISGQELSFLYREAAVNSVVPTEDAQELIVSVMITPEALTKFINFHGDLVMTDSSD